MRDDGVMSDTNLLGPEPTLLPEEPGATRLAAGDSPADVARAVPTSCAAWAALADAVVVDGADGGAADLTRYAYARVGYHRGLDALRRNGWKGHGPIPWEHVPNQGFLRCLATLSTSAARIDEDDEARRCAEFLADSSASAAALL